ncbi:unnamed protein product [Zymoseptoria tritici ST99CH_1A5]|uniref:Gem-associated protein 5 TPR domain-containing protein n=1 Tax=Zymoseptoria tritici ST99CH_1A5 TaxID=1276529 RepID=A0A1Y6LUB9_ZYMTR|nr:unnamed protein product [Zymoseptoria tritici ST99CH_1A5]
MNHAQRLDSTARHTPPPTSLTPETRDHDLEPCAATASFLLYAQRNTVLVLHHDTLAIERRFSLHREEVLWIVVDNVSERGSGRLAVSFDTGRTAIVWDILNGAEVARFSAYEHIKVASFMRNGNIAFGNDQGNIILFEPSTSEHVSSRTIFDPITAIAPAADCRTFAVGYTNGSILIVTLQPSFTIIHTLNTNRAPSKITGLGWHGSSSKQKSDMLATQTQDGDLRVWSVPKGQHTEAPTIIRILQRPETSQQGPCWFAWSKNGRLIQLADGETRAWDVRTKKVTYDIIPTIEGVTGVANYGPTATLFTLGRNHTVQQYDINPSTAPLQVATAQHAPANTPPTPPTALDEVPRKPADSRSAIVPIFTQTEDSSADESGGLSPLQKIAREMESLDALESEIRDKVMPLSPTSHGSVSSRSSGKPSRRQRRYLYDRPDSSRALTSSSYEGTEFSSGVPSKIGHESMTSMQSASSLASVTRQRSSNLRREILRSPDGTLLDLFPCTRARLREVAFRTPHYGEVARTPDLLRREMISVVFGWHDDVQSLIREELSRQRAGSASGVLLLQWLGDIGAADMASLVGSESMTSSDWMLLALSSIGSDSKKKVGEAFVQRLLEKGDIHAAVAILLGLNEANDAIEVYVSQQYCMEAVLLTALIFPSDWGRISYLLRKWGEYAVMNGEAELAVRCFSCTSIETSAPWTSPRAQEAVFAAQQERMTRPPSAGTIASPTLSNPSRSASGRLTAKNASLKLITNFDNKAANAADPLTILEPGTAGVTPIMNSALPMSPGGYDPWRNRMGRKARDPSSARTATPGGMARRTRLPSRDQIERAKQEAAEMATPLTAARDSSAMITPVVPARKTESRSSNSRTSSSVDSGTEPTTALRPTGYDFERLAPRMAANDDNHLPSPSNAAFSRYRAESRQRKPEHLAVQVDAIYADQMSPNRENNVMSPGGTLQSGTLSPPLTGGSGKASVKARANEEYVSSVEEARRKARYERAESRRRADSGKRTTSRSDRASSRRRELSEGRSKGQARHVTPGKRSPSSPIPMSPEEIAKASQQSRQVEPATTDDENYYKVGLQSPVESHRSGRSTKFPHRGTSRQGRVPSANQVDAPAVSRGLSADRAKADGRGRSEVRAATSATRSPSSPLPAIQKRANGTGESADDAHRFPLRSRSANRKIGEDLQSRRLASRDRREPSTSRKPGLREEAMINASELTDIILEEQSRASESSASTGQARGMSRKELAAKELEERRRSLARRPSAPAIPLPGEKTAGVMVSSNLRPSMVPRSQTDLGDSPTSYMPPMSRSQNTEVGAMAKHDDRDAISGTSTPSAQIGLPATPRAMRHPRYMGADPNERDSMPAVPDIPGKFSDMGSLSGSSLSQVTDSNLSQVSSSLLSSEHQQKSSLWSSDNSRSMVSEASDSIGPLLPSTVFTQPGSQGSSGRSVSAPPQDSSPIHPLYRSGLTSARRLSNVRKISPPDANAADGAESIVASIDATLRGSDHQVIIVPDQSEINPPMLPELRHLAMPPPPPPPPLRIPERTGLGVINIAVDDKSPSSAVDKHGPPLPQPMERASTASPHHRRNAPSGSGESFGARIRGISDRMRSGSKSRTKSPTTPADYRQSPYESFPLPFAAGHQRHGSVPQTHRAQSPYEQAMAQTQDQTQHNLAAPTSPSSEKRLYEMNIPPSSLPASRSGSASGGYRNPRDVRANMPPSHMQHGANPATNGFL